MYWKKLALLLLAIIATALCCGTGGTPYQTIVPQQVIDDAKTLFPEQKPPHSSIVSGDVLFTFNQTSNVNITFVWEGAGYRNTFGYFVLKQNPTLVPIFPDVTWNNQGGCLTTGSSIAISRNFTAGESIAFWVRADGYNNPNGNIWYSVHGMNGLFNSDGYRHTAWVRTGDKVLIGFEDLNNLGDGDYNDVMFYVTIDGTLSNNDDIPTYDNGTIEVCEGGQIVDYLEINCTQYALLSGVDTSSCQGYLSVPTGWEVAPDDQQSRNIIDTYGSRLNSDCIALLDGTGYKPDTLEICATNVIKNFTQDAGCITSGCSAQVLLRGKTKVSSCNGIENQQCDPTVKAKLLKTVPSTTFGTDALPLFPQSASVYLCCEAQLNLDVEIRKPVTPKVDIMLLVDTRGLSLERIQTLATDMGTVYDRLKSTNIYPSIGVAVWSGALTIKTVLTSQKAVLASSLNGVGTTSNTLDVSEGISVLTSSNVGWRSGSHRLVVILSAMPTFTAAINPIRQSSIDNLAVVDVLTVSSYIDVASTFVSNLPNGLAARVTNDLRDWIPRLSELVQLHAHEIKFTLASDAASVITQLPLTFSTSSFGTVDTKIELSYNAGITDEVSATAIVWGYGLLSIDAVINRPPSVVGETSFVVSFNETLAYSLTITDPDKNQVNVKYLSFVPSSASDWFDAPSTYTPDTRASITAPEDFFGNISATIRLSDGCIETDTKLNFKVLKNPNFPPTTFNYALITAEDQPVSVDIEARDFEDDTTTVTVIVSQISLLPVDGVFEAEGGQNIQVGTVLSYPRRVTFRPAQDKFSDPITTPLASIKYRAIDSQGASSTEKTTTVIVVPHNDPPILTGPVELWMDEDSTLHIPLDVWISDIDSSPSDIRMTVQRPSRGTILLCGTVDCQTLVGNEVIPIVPQPIFFRSAPDEFGNNYTVIRIALSDGLNQTDASITIHVRPINDAPIIHPFFDVLPGVVSFDEDTAQRFDFNVTDIDSDLRYVIVTLNSQVPTSGKWEVCKDSDCNDRILLSARSEIPAYAAGRYAMMLTPEPNVYDARSFTRLILGARDAEGGYARPVYANIRVLPINDPPVIRSTMGDTISITSSDTALLNLGFLTFSDVDSGRKSVNVTIKLTGASSFVIPTDDRFSKVCQVDDKLLTCLDAVSVVSDLWIKQVFVNVSAQSFLDVTIDDLGHTDKWDRPLNDTKSFTIIVREDTGIVTDTVDEVSLAIGLSISLAASVGAVVGLSLWLRKRYAGVSEDYFESLADKIADSNQNPLYVATSLEGANPLYKAE